MNNDLQLSREVLKRNKAAKNSDKRTAVPLVVPVTKNLFQEVTDMDVTSDVSEEENLIVLGCNKEGLESRISNGLSSSAEAGKQRSTMKGTPKKALASRHEIQEPYFLKSG